MKDMERFLKNLGGSMVWILVVLILIMVTLRFVKSKNIPVLSTVATDAQNLATSGSVSGN